MPTKTRTRPRGTTQGIKLPEGFHFNACVPQRLADETFRASRFWRAELDDYAHDDELGHLFYLTDGRVIGIVEDVAHNLKARVLRHAS